MTHDNNLGNKKGHRANANGQRRVTMKNGVKLLRTNGNRYLGVSVELTSMTAKSGTIVYAVLVRSLRSGRQKRIWKFTTLGKAWERYKGAMVF